jgi:uncharacterized protein (TIGR01777 family)
MRVLVSGAGGLIGSALCPVLEARGHRVSRLVRHPAASEDAVRWDPEAGAIEAAKLEGLDAAVHLAGANIGTRWTAGTKDRIRRSRVDTARLLAETLAARARPPRVLLAASAVGYYGDCGEETLTEESGPGCGFLAELCRAWEEATGAAAGAGVRVVNLRMGVVLTARGGVLARMLPPFRLGLGGRLGGGRQYLSWIAMEDLLAVVLHGLEREELRGPVNATSPRPVTNHEFTRALGRALGRPAPFVVPAFALRLAFGQMAEETLLASARAVPARLQAGGFEFRHAELEGALRHVLGR